MSQDQGDTRQEFGGPPEQAARDTQDEAFEEQADQFEQPTETQGEEEASLAPAAFSEAQVDARLLEVLNAVSQQLKTQGAGMQAANFQGAHNLQGVGVGFAGEGAASGGEPGAASLNVYVAEETSPEEVRSIIVSAMGVQAASSSDVPINVIKSGVFDAQPHRMRLRPAPGGISVGHYKITAGTLGCLATGRTAPRNQRLLMLSNNHVLANSNNATYGDAILQQGSYDGGKSPADRNAILERFVPIRFGGPVNYVDAATGWCWPNLVRRELMYISGGTVKYFRVSSAPVGAALGMLVGKSGRTTQLTTGRVTDLLFRGWVNYGSGRRAWFEDQLVIRGLSGDFSAGGDSGSLIWTWNANRNPVGLLFAGGGGLTIANKIGRVLPALDIRLYT